MRRAAIYARFSSENQREASIEDQIEICRRYARTHDLEIAQVFEDRALSGAGSARPGYQALLAAARNGSVDAIVVESLDRLTRKLSENARLHDELQFKRAELHATNIGAVSMLHVGVLGTMAQMRLADLRDKTRRGQLGRVLQGRAAGGKAYGYDVVADDGERGGRRVNAAEAVVVQRIFQAFANGASPRAIAHRLNEEAVPGPDGRPWIDTTIRGQKDRGTGILNNEIYIGELVWNRCSYVKDPTTGRRVARPNPPSGWERRSVPDLRIVDDALWQAAKRRQEVVTVEMARDADGNALNRAHRRRFLLSGLLVCGACGAGYTIAGKDRYACAGRRGKGTCSNERTISRQEVEGRILTALKDRLLTPDLVAEFTRAYQEEVNRLSAESRAGVAGARSALAGVQRKIDGLLRAIEDGMYQPSMKERLAELEAEKARLEAQLKAPSKPAVLVHPNLGELYRKRVAALEALLDDSDHRDEAMELIRSMIDRIVVTPKDGRGVSLTLHGDLARILTLCAAAGEGRAQTAKSPDAGASGLRVSVVAGACNRLCLPISTVRSLRAGRRATLPF